TVRASNGWASNVSLRAGELAFPATFSPAFDAIAFDTAHHPIVWSTPVGAGRLVVSGALDAWRYRDAAASQFDLFWRELIANEADRVAPPIVIDPSRGVAAPGERIALDVTLRAPAI